MRDSPLWNPGSSSESRITSHELLQGKLQVPPFPFSLEPTHSLHKTPRLFKLPEQPVHVLDRGAATFCDATAAAAVDEMRMRSLVRRHRVNDRLHPAQGAFVHPSHPAFRPHRPWEHLHKRFQRAHRPDLA